MRSLLSRVYLMIHFSAALNVLPAPVNLSVVSLNFHHVLHWDPGPETPPGTLFKVIGRVNGRNKLRHSLTNGTRFVLKLRSEIRYWLSVQATHPQYLESPESEPYSFNPMEQTVIGRPSLSLLGCDNCIRVNISLPKADARTRIPDIQKFYQSFSRIYYRKAGETRVSQKDTENNSFTLENLQPGVEYCLQVQIMIRINSNSELSDWVCTYTSVPEPSRVPAAVGAVVCVFLLCNFALVILVYTGLLCELKAQLPMVLLTSLVHGNVLTPERTIPAKVFLLEEEPGTTLHRRRSQPDDEEEEEDDDEGESAYMDRGEELSSGSTCHPDSQDASGVSWESSGGHVEKSPPAAVDLWCGPPPEVQGETGVDSGEQAGTLGSGSGGTEEGWGSEKGKNSGNVNLHSVMLWMGVEEEEEEEEEQNAIESSSEVFNKTRTPLPTSDCGDGKYESRDRKNTDIFSGFPQSGAGETALLCGMEEKEEEEEEELSGYMGR